MATYSEIKNGLDEISSKNNKFRKAVTGARETLVWAQTGLAAMQTEYSALVADINTAVAANPTNEAYIVAGKEKAALVADFLALKTWVDSLIAAVDSVA